MTGLSSKPGFHGLHVLVDDDSRWRCDPVAQARAACAGGANVIQLRAKHTGDRACLVWARAIRALTRSCGVSFVLNDRFDLALAAEADAVHLGQDDLPPAAIPAQARERLAVGRSTHTPDQARAACAEPVDYVAFGPIFGTTSKDSPHPARGLELLRKVAELVRPRPLVAIGGIDAGCAGDVVLAGADAIAVISAVAGAPDSERATRELVTALAETQRARVSR